MAIDNNTLAHLGNVEDPIALKNFLLLLLQQVDRIIGNRTVDANYDYSKVVPSVAYDQIEAIQVADDLETLYNRVADIEAKLQPINN